MHDNVFIGYNAGYNNTSALSNANNHYKNNTFINCNWLRMQYTEANTFKNCTIEYIFDSDKTLAASTFTNCTLYRRPGCALTTSNCTLNNSTVKELNSTSTTPTSISIPSTFSIKQGESKTIPMMIMPTTALRDGEPLTKEVRWQSSDWSKVYVSEIGTVYAIGNPEGVTITCTSRVDANARGTCTLTANTTEQPTTTFTITNNLSNCTSTNNNSSVNLGSSYLSTISPNNGYTISSIVVTMAERDITSTVVSNNNINIPNVTGNIVITATATLSSSGDDSDIYVIPISNYGISNDNTNARATTKGIIDALVEAKANGHNKIKLPPGTYAIDAVTENTADDTYSDGTPYKIGGRGVALPSDIELILTDCVVQQEPAEEPDTRVLILNKCKNTKVTGGTIIGDR